MLRQTNLFLLCLTLLTMNQFAFGQSSSALETGTQLFHEGYYDSACYYLRTNFQEGDSLNTAANLFFAESLGNAGQVPEALSVLDKTIALAINQADTASYVSGIVLKGENMIRVGQVSQSKELYEQAFQQFEKPLSSSFRAKLYSRLGLVEFYLGHFEMADSLLGKAQRLMVNKGASKEADQAVLYKYEGAVADRLNRFDSAIYYYEKSLDINKEIYGDDHPETAKVYSNLANVYHVIGQNRKALAYFDKAHDIFEKYLGKDHLILSTILNNMAIVDYDMGNFERSITYYKSALHLCEQKIGLQNMHAAQIMSNISSSYIEMHNGSQALEYGLKSLQVREKILDNNNIMFAPCLVNIAAAYIQQGDFRKANQYVQRALAIYEHHGKEQHSGLAESYTNLGESYLAQNQNDKAVSFLQKARQLSIEMYTKDNFKIAFIDELIGKAYAQLQMPDSATYYFDQAIRIAVPGFETDARQWKVAPEVPLDFSVSRNVFVKAMSGKAGVLYDQFSKKGKGRIEDLRSANRMYDFLCDFLDEVRNDYRREETKLFLTKMARPIYDKAIDVAWALYDIEGDPALVKRAFQYSEKSKYALISDFINDISAKHASGISQEMMEEEITLKSNISFAQKSFYESGSDSLKEVFQKQVTAAQKQYLEFTEKLKEQYPEYFQLKYSPSTVTVGDVQKVLAKDQQLVEYDISDSVLYVFSIHRDSINFYHKNIEGNLQTMVKDMRTGLVDHDFEKYTQNARKLYQLLAADWKKSNKQIIIVPDGVLGYVPFEILLTKGIVGDARQYWQLPYLLKEHVLSYNYSAGLFLSEQQDNKDRYFKNFIAGFAPVFSGQNTLALNQDSGQVEREDRFVRLAGAEEELGTLSDMFNGEFFLGNDATEEHFMDVKEKSRVLHLGTHAILNDKNPDMSYLVFAPNSASNEDNLLHTYEVYNMHIDAELVTLSACNTGAGQLVDGEGIMSLARGFAYAGAPNIVTSLWSASDYATGQLMQRFYYYLSNGWSKSKALNQAKLDFLNQADDNLSDPYFWGSFILIGDPQPLHIPRYTWLIWVIAVSGVLVLSFLFFRKFLRS